jgi:hypothetical protein
VTSGGRPRRPDPCGARRRARDEPPARGGGVRSARPRRDEEDTSESTSLLQQSPPSTDEAFGAARRDGAATTSSCCCRRSATGRWRTLRVASGAGTDLAGDDPVEDVEAVVRRFDPQHEEALEVAQDTVGRARPCRRW